MVTIYLIHIVLVSVIVILMYHLIKKELLIKRLYKKVEAWKKTAYKTYTKKEAKRLINKEILLLELDNRKSKIQSRVFIQLKNNLYHIIDEL